MYLINLAEDIIENKFEIFYRRIFFHFRKHKYIY